MVEWPTEPLRVSRGGKLARGLAGRCYRHCLPSAGVNAEARPVK